MFYAFLRSDITTISNKTVPSILVPILKILMYLGLEIRSLRPLFVARVYGFINVTVFELTCKQHWQPKLGNIKLCSWHIKVLVQKSQQTSPLYILPSVQ